MSGSRARGDVRAAAPLWSLARLFCIGALAWLLAGCSAEVGGTVDRWMRVESGGELVQHPSWLCHGGVSAQDGALSVHASDDEPVRFLVNRYGLRLRTAGAFGVTARISAPAEGLAAFSLVGRLGSGKWWAGTRRLDVGLAAEQAVVNYFDGSSFMPRLSEAFPVDRLSQAAELTLRAGDAGFVLLVDGAEIGRIDAGVLAREAVFPDGFAYFGVTLQGSTSLTLQDLGVEVVRGGDVAGVLLPPTDDSMYEPTSPALRELATANQLRIGAAVNPTPLRCEEAYGQVLSHEFNVLTTENALKFGPVHPEPERYEFTDADAIVDFAEAHNMAVRGHTLVWHRQVPEWVTALASDAESTEAQWETLLQDHITTVVGRYRGRVQVWDVVNEAIEGGPHRNLRQTVWLEGLGDDYIDKAFRWAHEADPEALLFYNDYGAEGMGGKSQQVYDLVAGMVARGVPIHGVGLQMHLTLSSIPDPDDVLQNMRRLGELGLDVHITELDVRLPADPSEGLYERQAAVYRDLMEVCLSAENCTAFVMWGLTDRYSWIPHHFPEEGNALIFDRHYRPKRAYQALGEVLMTTAAIEGGESPVALPELPAPQDFGAECDCLP